MNHANTEKTHAAYVEQSDQHVVLLGVVDRCGGCNCAICNAHGKCLALRSRSKTVFLPHPTISSHLQTTEMPESSDLRLATFVQTKDRRQTKTIGLPLAHASTVINNYPGLGFLRVNY